MEFIITRDLMYSYSQRVLVRAETKEEALYLSEVDCSDNVHIIDDVNHGSVDIENNDIQTPAEAYETIKNMITTEFGKNPDFPFDFAGRHFKDIKDALQWYAKRFHLPK